MDDALSADALRGFHRAQQLAYECAETVGDRLTPGVTERDTARMMRDFLTDRGVHEWFHKPFAWFGDRTAFSVFGLRRPFFPTGRRLEDGMPVILDVGPVVDGYPADIGYATRVGENPLHDRMLADLEPYRSLILDGVRSGRTLRRIYADVDALITDQGYANRHRVYPGRVLAHRVGRVETPVNGATIGGFGLPAIGFLASEIRAARNAVTHHTTLWNPTEPADRPAAPGLWAVEPHIGFHSVGVKWEELLVVTDDDAYWLDDDLPHVRRWRRTAVQGAA